MEIKYRRDKKRWLKIVKDYNEGAKIKDIMEKYAISKEGIYYILRQLAKDGSKK